MKILIVGCGGIGGYFGARLVEAGVPVTFLARANSAKKLNREGLHLHSSRGNVSVSVQALTKEQLTHTYDLVLLTCKAYDLTQCLEDSRPAVGNSTYVLPMLNGFTHYEKIRQAFPEANLLYGYCNVSAAKDSQGYIQHYNSIHEMTLGSSEAIEDDDTLNQIIALIKQAHFNLRVSKNIEQELWEKFIFINALAGATVLLRGTIGDILTSPYGKEVALQIIDECQSVANAHGFTIRPRANKIIRDAFSQVDSPLSASMLKDIQNNRTIEINLISELCDFAAQKNVSIPFMHAVHSQLAVYSSSL